MNNRKLALLVIFTAIFLVGSYMASGSASGLGLSDLVETVVGPAEPVAPDIMAPAEQVRFWSGRLSEDTKDYITLTHLGRAYLQLARETGDAGAYARAEEALRRALHLNPSYAPANGLLGSVLIGRHAFTEALAGAKATLATDPDDTQALAVMGDSALELGDYDTAGEAYLALLDKAPDGPAFSRMSRLSWLLGRPDEAIDWMRRAAGHVLDLDVGGEELAWYRFQLGELYFNTGDLRDAAKWYREADQAMPDYYLSQAGLGKIAAARGDLDEAVRLYARLVERNPQPAFISYLVSLYTLQGDEAAAQAQRDTLAVIFELEQTRQTPYDRQLTMYFANHNTNLQQALASAEAELAARQDIYAYDTLAWVLYRLGRYEDAQAAINRALANGTRDAQLYFHSGMIAAALGDSPHAIEQLSLALDVNPYFDPLQARVARNQLSELDQ